MTTGTGLFWLALAVVLVALSSMFEFEYIDIIPTKDGVQHHIIRYNNLTGELDACVVDFDDAEPWGSCVLHTRQ